MEVIRKYRTETGFMILELSHGGYGYIYSCFEEHKDYQGAWQIELSTEPTKNDRLLRKKIAVEKIDAFLDKQAWV